MRTFLPKVRDALVASANSDEALNALVIRLARRGYLEGSLIAELARSRPTSLDGIAEQLGQVGPKLFLDADLVLDQMQSDLAFRGSFSQAAFVALGANWSRRDVDRYYELMEASQPDWFCHRLNQFDSLLIARAKALPSLEAIPYFAEKMLKRTIRQCPNDTVAILSNLLKDSDVRRRAGVAFLVATEMPKVASTLADQAFLNLVQTDSLDKRDPFQNHHARMLSAASLTCAELADRVSARISIESKESGTLAAKLNPLIDRLRSHQYPELCRQ